MLHLLSLSLFSPLFGTQPEFKVELLKLYVATQISAWKGYWKQIVQIF